MTTPTFRPAVGVMGAGRWGTALAHVIGTSGRDVWLFSRDEALCAAINTSHTNATHLPELDQIALSVHATSDLAALADACHLIVMAVSVQNVRSAVQALSPHVDGSHVIVHAVRGLEPDTFATPSAIIERETCVRKVGAFVGPTMVEELLAGRPNAAVVASRFPEVLETARAALVSPMLRIYGNRDVVGVEAAAAASNIIAIAVGVADALDLGPTTIAVLITRGVAEIGRICEALGGSDRSAFGLAGLGDLLLLRESESRESRAGKRIATGQSVAQVVEELGTIEGFAAAKTFHALATARGVRADITAVVHDFVYGELTPREAVGRLMGLAQTAE